MSRLGLVILLLGQGTGASASIVCTASMGCVEGTDSGSAVAYLGLRFAAEATGPNRWKRPMPASPQPTSSDAPFQATEHYPCLQSSDNGNSFFGSEAGCLTVDVFVPPGTAADARLPVMVWIHGGSFLHFSPTPNATNPSLMISTSSMMDSPVIVVSVNYRLGGLGFMGSAALAGETDAHGSSGNYGILDQIAALEWVQQNIQAFGGNKGAVTIFGESAGAYSVCVLLASPLVTGRGLFARAAMDSAYCGLTYQYQSLSQEIGSACEAMHSCPSTDPLTCMRSITAEQAYACGPLFLIASGHLPAYVDSETLPNIDGYVLDKPPVTAIASPTEGATVPVIVGSNRNEMMLFAMYSPLFVPWNLSAADRPAVLRQMLVGLSRTYKNSTASPDIGAVLSDSDLATALALYPVEQYASFAANAAPFFATLCQLAPVDPIYAGAPCTFTAEAASVVSAATDFAFTFTAKQISDAVEQSGQPAYRYLFGENGTGAVVPNPVDPSAPPLTDTYARLGSFHSIDVSFLFGNFGPYWAEFHALWPPAAATAVADRLSASMMTYYISFATNGDPNGLQSDAIGHIPALGGVLPEWPRWGQPGTEYMELGGPEGIQAGSGFHASQLALWARLADKAGLFGSGSTPARRPISAVSKHKLSAGDDVLIGIGVFVVIFVAAIVGAFVLKARNAKNIDAGYEDGVVLVG